MKRIFAILLLFLAATSAKAYNHAVVGVPSPSMQKEVAVTIITPDSYDTTSTEGYNVVYLLHGYSDNNESWYERGKVGPYADQYNLIFVCPDGNNSWYWDSPVDSSYRYETFVAEELVAWVDANYNTSPQRTSRAITGLSMGGHGALIIDCGTEDFFYEVNCALHTKMAAKGIPHDFYVRPGQHNWHYWVGSIQHQLLFFSNYFKRNK